ncbi:response regulator transcription factor [Bacillus sp. FJAT-27445]|uniref:response regulator transcription factor n=1 Tax=Bacillus sp. FJAT-27445 TaxID=1679166 RepID=UPI00074427A6|nr:response regulator [Bacillus sp. FJAT-27445]
MRRILLVDDESLMLDLLELYLKPKGFHCMKARSGEDAKAAVSEDNPDIIIMDVMMPDKDGWETASEIREISSAPIIMLTARDQPEDILRSFHCGATSHISKPFDEETLLMHVQSIVKNLQ